MQLPDTVVVLGTGGDGTSTAMTILIAVAAALVAAIGSYVTQERRLRAELQKQEERIRADLQLQETRIRADLELQQQKMRTEFMAEQAVRRLLEHETYTKRQFKTTLGGLWVCPDEPDYIVSDGGGRAQRSQQRP